MFQVLLSAQGQELLAALPAYDESSSLGLGARLRRRYPGELVAAAMTQARLRARARAKFGPDADRLYFTPAGLEQATRAAVAARRAQRYAGAASGRVVDLCCGIGGDLLELAATGLPVLGVDRDPLAVAVAGANAAVMGRSERVSLRCADVADIALGPADAVFCDPARRDEAGRRLNPRSWSPPYSWLLELAARVPATAAKVAPGIAHHSIPPDAEAEWVSDGGDVVEAALWWGPLASGVRRRATLLPSGLSLVDEGLGPPPISAPRRYLYEPDGAVIRAGLVAEVAARLDGALIDSSIAYVTSDRRVTSPYATRYEITDVLPFSLKRLRALLRARRVGSVVVKKRGSAVEPEQLRHQLRLAGPAAAVVILTRVAGVPSVLLAEAQPAGEPARSRSR